MTTMHIDGSKLSAEEVLRKIQEATNDASVDTVTFNLGHDYKLLTLDVDAVPQALVQLVVSTYGSRRWKKLQFDFSSPGYVEQYSKKEDRWKRLETKCKQHVTRLARHIQTQLDLTETEMRIDGDIHEDVDVSSHVHYTGKATVSFLKVRRETMKGQV
jgi:hypothetical protein